MAGRPASLLKLGFNSTATEDWKPSHLGATQMQPRMGEQLCPVHLAVRLSPWLLVSGG